MDKPAQWALVGAAWFLALTVAVISFLAWRHFESRTVMDKLTTAALQGAAEALPLGAQTVCPVTKEPLVVASDTPSLVYKDRYYYFSRSPDAAGHEPKRRFIMDPEFYVAPGTPPLAAHVPSSEATAVEVVTAVVSSPPTPVNTRPVPVNTPVPVSPSAAP